jgi:hypothetical protein
MKTTGSLKLEEPKVIAAIQDDQINARAFDEIEATIQGVVKAQKTFRTFMLLPLQESPLPMHSWGSAIPWPINWVRNSTCRMVRPMRY